MEARRRELAEAVAEAWRWLAGGGNLLGSHRRRDILRETVACFGECQACLMARSTCYLQPPLPSQVAHADHPLRDLVHWIANLQKLCLGGRQWLDCFLADVRIMFPAYAHDDMAVASLYCEIVVVTAFAHQSGLVCSVLDGLAMDLATS